MEPRPSVRFCKMCECDQATTKFWHMWPSWRSDQKSASWKLWDGINYWMGVTQWLVVIFQLMTRFCGCLLSDPGCITYCRTLVASPIALSDPRCITQDIYRESFLLLSSVVYSADEKEGIILMQWKPSKLPVQSIYHWATWHHRQENESQPETIESETL